jgi:hypothetical protein
MPALPPPDVPLTYPDSGRITRPWYEYFFNRDLLGNVQSVVRPVAFNTPGIGTADTIKIGTLPAGAQIVSCIVRLTVAFNAGTTNVLTVGTSVGSNADIVSASDVNEGVIGTTIVSTGAGLSFAANTAVYVRYTQTGAAATTGAAVITLIYA